jgi:hypothetical protein
LNRKNYVRASILLALVSYALIYSIPSLQKNPSTDPWTIPVVYGILCLYLGRFIYYLRIVRPEQAAHPRRSGLFRRFGELIICGPLIACSLMACFNPLDRQNPIFHDAIQIVRTSSIAKSEIGNLQKTAWFISEKGESTPGLSHESMWFPVYGSRSNAILHVSGTKANGVWEIDELYLTPQDSDTRTDLIEGGPVPTGAH